MPFIFLKSSDQNFEIGVLFKIVESPNSHASGDTMTPTPPGERSLSYKISPLLTHSICYWEYTYIFRVEIFCWWYFLQGFSMRREVFSGNFTLWELARIPTKFYSRFYSNSNALLFLCQLNFTRGGIFPWRCSQIFKHNQKKKQVFSIESKESN